MDVVKYIRTQEQIDNLADELCEVLVNQPKTSVVLCFTNLAEADTEGRRVIERIEKKIRNKYDADVRMFRLGKYMRVIDSGSIINTVSTRANGWDSIDYDYYINMYSIYNRRWAIPKYKCEVIAKNVFMPDEDVAFF